MEEKKEEIIRHIDKKDIKTYKNVSIYDAELKKNKSYLIKRQDFQTDDEMMEYIKKLRAEQRIKNAQYRKMLKEGKINRIEEVIINPVQNLYGNIVIENSYNLKLDPATGNTTALFGSSKRGKSSLLMDIYNRYYAIDKDFISTLFSINAHNPTYKKDKNLLKCSVFNAKSEKYIKLEKHINSKTKNHYKFLNMLDDITDIKYTKLINQLILTYRNSNISTIICLQYGYLLSKANRANINNIIIFGCNTDEAIKDLIDTFLKHYFIKLGYKKYEEQIGLFKYVTDNHGFMMINPIDDKLTFHKLNL